MRILISALALLLSLGVLHAQETPSIQMGLSDEAVEISSSFNGTDVVIFGSIENAEKQLLERKAYHVVVVLVGPTEEMVVRRKEHQYGIWANGKSQMYSDVPSSYTMATTRNITEIADAEEIKILQIGLQNISFVNNSNDSSPEDDKIFRESLLRLKSNQDLYQEGVGGVEFLSPTLFRARLAVPANVPIGLHTARAYLFNDGKYVNSTTTKLTVRKIGFEQYTYELAHQNGLLYGIIAVLIAIATGWLASVIFRKD